MFEEDVGPGNGVVISSGEAAPPEARPFEAEDSPGPGNAALSSAPSLADCTVLADLSVFAVGVAPGFAEDCSSRDSGVPTIRTKPSLIVLTIPDAKL